MNSIASDNVAAAGCREKTRSSSERARRLRSAARKAIADDHEREPEQVEAAPLQRVLRALIVCRETDSPHSIHRAGLDQHAALVAAQTNFDVPAHLELPVAEADADLAAVQTELTNLPSQLVRAEARLRLAKIDLESKLAARDSQESPTRSPCSVSRAGLSVEK